MYQLLQCVRHGDKNKIKKLLRLGVPNLLNLSEPSEGQAALHLACIAPDPEMVEFLLSQVELARHTGSPIPECNDPQPGGSFEQRDI